MADVETWAIVIAAVGVVTSVAAFLWGRIDAVHFRRRQDKADEGLKEVRAQDRAILQFGKSWGGLALDALEDGPWKEGVLVPIENVGRRDGSISYAEWAVEHATDGLLVNPQPGFLRPRRAWSGKGDLTVPAGSRRLFMLPLPERARAALNSEEELLTLYVRPVASDDLIRARIDDQGVHARPWNAQEEAEADLVATIHEEQARYYEEAMAR